MASQITHFTHPGHHLAKVQLLNKFTCGACKAPGSGPRYRCTEPHCSFDLHAACASCPERVRFFLHPKHDLVRRGAPRLLPRVCDVCGKGVHGIFYTCCGVDVHPPCTRIPETLTAPAHPEHAVSFVRGSSGRCARCEAKCEAGRYRCKPCGIDLHIKCLRRQAVEKQHGGSQSRRSKLKKMAAEVAETSVECWLSQQMKGSNSDNKENNGGTDDGPQAENGGVAGAEEELEFGGIFEDGEGVQGGGDDEVNFDYFGGDDHESSGVEAIIDLFAGVLMG